MVTRRSGRVGVSRHPVGPSGRARQFQSSSSITGRKRRFPRYGPGAMLTLFALITFLLVPVLALLPLPQAVSGSSVATPAVAAGFWHTVGLRSDGTVVAVGYNGSGQCNVYGWTDIVQVSAGGSHTVGLRSDGTVVAVGYNGSGQCNVYGWVLDVRGTTPPDTPTNLSPDDGIAGLPLWAWILIGVTVVVVGGGALYFIRRRPASP